MFVETTMSSSKCFTFESLQNMAPDMEYVSFFCKQKSVIYWHLQKFQRILAYFTRHFML